MGGLRLPLTTPYATLAYLFIFPIFLSLSRNCEACDMWAVGRIYISPTEIEVHYRRVDTVKAVGAVGAAAATTALSIGLAYEFIVRCHNWVKGY